MRFVWGKNWSVHITQKFIYFWDIFSQKEIFLLLITQSCLSELQLNTVSQGKLNCFPKCKVNFSIAHYSFNCLNNWYLLMNKIEKYFAKISHMETLATHERYCSAFCLSSFHFCHMSASNLNEPNKKIRKNWW